LGPTKLKCTFFYVLYVKIYEAPRPRVVYTRVPALSQGNGLFTDFLSFPSEVIKK